MTNSVIGTIRRLACTGATAAVLAFAGAFPAAAQGQLNVYNWGDYINPEVLTLFTEETGIEVTLDTYGTNEEMLAKIQAGATGYDIVFPSVHVRDIMQKLGLLWNAEVNKLPGFENIDPVSKRSKVDPESEYCLPYAWGAVGIFYNKEEAGELNTWEDFFALPDRGKKIVMLDDLRETIGVALILNGHSVNSTDSDELKQGPRRCCSSSNPRFRPSAMTSSRWCSPATSLPPTGMSAPCSTF